MWKALFRFFASLKLAVVVILLLAGVLAIATVAESLYGMRGAYHLVYGQLWFAGLLFLLGLNVACAALIRFPWKPRQMGFVITHLGIIVLLVGSWVTQKWGVDGSLPVVEGGESNSVFMPEMVLTVRDEEGTPRGSFTVPESAFKTTGQVAEVAVGSKVFKVVEFLPRVSPERSFIVSPFSGVGSTAAKLQFSSARFEIAEWIQIKHPTKPTELNLGPAVVTFLELGRKESMGSFLNKPVASTKEERPQVVIAFQGQSWPVNVDQGLKRWQDVGSSGLQVLIEKYLPYAVVDKKELVSRSNEPVNPAVQLLLKKKNEPNEASEKHTLFAFYPEFNTLHKQSLRQNPIGAEMRLWMPDKDPRNQRGRLELAVKAGQIGFRSFGRDGSLKNKGLLKIGEEVGLGWMDIRFKVTDFIPDAVEKMVPHYVEKVAGTQGSFVSAIKVAGPHSEQWIFEGEGVAFPVGNEAWTLQYERRSLALDFKIFLQKFTIGTDPGTTKAASYSSDVRLKLGPNEISKDTFHISMNDPLKHGGYTFYQASYQMEQGKPPVSVFSVNYDPGRSVKYLGSLLIVIGVMLMFYLNPQYWNILFGRKS